MEYASMNWYFSFLPSTLFFFFCGANDLVAFGVPGVGELMLASFPQPTYAIFRKKITESEPWYSPLYSIAFAPPLFYPLRVSQSVPFL